MKQESAPKGAPRIDPARTITTKGNTSTSLEVRPLGINQMPAWCEEVLSGSQRSVENPIFRWRKVVIASPTLPSRAKLVALVVADRCRNGHEHAWPSLARISADASLSKTTVVAAIRDLERAGFVHVRRDDNRGRARQANRYYLSWPPVMEAEWATHLASVVASRPAFEPTWSSHCTAWSSDATEVGAASSPEGSSSKALTKEQGNLSDAEREILTQLVIAVGREPITESEHREFERVARELSAVDAEPWMVRESRTIWDEVWCYDYQLTPGAIAKQWGGIEEACVAEFDV